MDKKVNRLFFLACCYVNFVNGLLVLMTGAILTHLMRDYNLNYNQGGLLVSVQAVGNLLAGLFSGVIIHLLGRKRSMLLVSAMFIGFGGIIFTSSPILLFIFIFLTGIGWGLSNNLVNVLVSEATHGDGAYTNILHMTFAVGAFLSPLIVSAFTGWNVSWKVAVALVSVISSSLVFVFLKISFEDVVKQGKNKEKLSFEFFKDPKYFIYIMVLFCYVGAEVGLNSWLITYLVEQGIMEIGKAQVMLSLLWVTIIFGRIFTAYISKYVRKDLLLAGTCLAMFIFLGLFLANKNPNLMILSIIAIGISMAGIYPTTIANASYIVKGTGLGSGIMFAGSGLGAVVVPYVAGAIAGDKGMLVGLLSTLVIVMFMLMLSIINIILVKQEDKPVLKNAN